MKAPEGRRCHTDNGASSYRRYLEGDDNALGDIKEILDTVLEMRDEYFARQRRRKKLIFRSASLLSAAAVIAVVIGISSPGSEVIAPPEIEIAEETPAVTSVKSASQTSPASSQQTQTAVNKTTYTTSKAVVTEAAADSSVQAKSEVRTSVSADNSMNVKYFQKNCFIHPWSSFFSQLPEDVGVQGYCR